MTVPTATKKIAFSLQLKAFQAGFTILTNISPIILRILHYLRQSIHSTRINETYWICVCIYISIQTYGFIFISFPGIDPCKPPYSGLIIPRPQIIHPHPRLPLLPGEQELVPRRPRPPGQGAEGLVVICICQGPVGIGQRPGRAEPVVGEPSLARPARRHSAGRSHRHRPSSPRPRSPPRPARRAYSGRSSQDVVPCRRRPPDPVPGRHRRRTCPSLRPRSPRPADLPGRMS